MPTINSIEASYRLYLSRLSKQGNRLDSFVVDGHASPPFITGKPAKICL